MLPLWGIVEIGKRIIQKPFGWGWWNATKSEPRSPTIPESETQQIIIKRTAKAKEKDDNVLLYVGIGVGVVILIIVIMAIAGKK